MGRRRTISDAQIISAARWLFITQGRSVAMCDIADHVEISESVLYDRFGSREGLFRAAVTPTPVAVDDVLGPPAALDDLRSQADARLWLLGVARALVMLCHDVLPLQWLTFGEIEDDERYRQMWRADPCHAVVVELELRLKKLDERGLLAVQSPHDAAVLLLAAARDVVFREASRPSSYPARVRTELQVDPLFEQIWAGLAPRRRTGESVW